MFSWHTRSFLDKHWSDIDTTSILYKLNLTWYKWFESNWYFICHPLFDWLNFLLPFVLVSTKQCGTSHKYTSIYSFSFYFFPCLVGFSHFIITTFAWEKFTVKRISELYISHIQTTSYCSLAKPWCYMTSWQFDNFYKQQHICICKNFYSTLIKVLNKI